MMNERQMGFRREYRSRIAGWYNGYVHVMVIYTIGLTAMYIYTRHIADVQWWEWLTIPAVALVCNIFEWFLHMYVMHRPINNRGMRAIYTRHTLNHHQFFTDGEMRFRDQKDWRVTFFPPYAMVVFILMSIPGGLVLGWLITPNVGWLMMCSTTGMYLVYEFMHLVRAQYAAGQHSPPPSHGASQQSTDDGGQYEPDLPGCRLAFRHVGP